MRWKSLFFLTLCFGWLVANEVNAQNVECDEFYTVRRGDTLQKIAYYAYGRGSAYQILYSSNREVIGGRPGVIQTGTKLWIPCLGESQHQKRKSVHLPELKTASAANAQVKLLTGGDFAPFTDQGLENDGLIAELVNRSLQASDPDLNYRVDFINDWSSHLNPLLKEGSYDMGFPWYKPDCTKYDQLGESSKWRCDNLYFSDPFFETVVSYFGRRSDNTTYITPSDLKGKTLCRPSGYFTFDLEVRELVAPNVTLLQPATVKECFEMLMKARVDIITMNVMTADSIIKKLELSGKLVEHEDLATIETLHVVVARTHPRARPLLLRINRGLTALQRNRTYQNVVGRHLAEFMK